MKRMPSAKTLARKISIVPKNSRTTIQTSIDYLASQQSTIAKYETVEQFVLAEDCDERLKRACAYHLLTIRSQLARELWSRELFIGVTVLDDLLFYEVAHGTSANPILQVLEIIRDRQLHHPGIVIFPVHSFGILGEGWQRWFTDVRVEYTLSKFGLALSPQTNSLAKTLEFLQRASTLMGVRKNVPANLIQHWSRTGARWLEINPLLVVKVQSFPGSYYENQFLLMTKLRSATTLLSMLATLQPTTLSSDREHLLSSSRINNFQTLDIKHYIVLYNAPSRRRELSGDLVPMHVQGPALAEVSDLGIELDPRFWRHRRNAASGIHAAIASVHSGYLKYSFGAKRDETRGRVYRKVFESMAYFRRSFQRSDEQWSSIISLAIAYEMLLTDNYSPGVTERIIRRVKLVLRSVPRVRSLVASVKDLYEARGGIVHSGMSRLEVDLPLARKAYVHVFVELASRLPSLPDASSTPMKDLCGDRKA